MTGQPGFDVDALHRGLRRALRQGARASRLVKYVPQVVEMLYPAAAHSDMSLCDRAICAETLIRQAVESIGGNTGQALATVLCLSAGTLGRSLSDRRRVAARMLSMEADTFRREQHEKALLYDVAVEMYRIRRWRSPGNNPPT